LDLAVFEGASTGLLDEDDRAEAAAAIEPGSSAGILLFENRWAVPFVQALRNSEAQVIAAGYVPVDAMLESVDALESGARRAPNCDERTEDRGLVRGVARTAVVAGTATAVSNRVSRRQANRWSEQEQQQYAQQQQYAPPPPAPAAAPAPDPIAQLKELAELKSQGILTEAEFAAQ